MGRSRRPQPKKLKSKLGKIRLFFEMTQDDMATNLCRFGAESSIHSGYVADFENGKREPSLLVLLAYARLAGLSTDYLIDDKLSLPEKLPGNYKTKR
jgi:transcriptional regulator with XRE-family HTH domain